MMASLTQDMASPKYNAHSALIDEIGGAATIILALCGLSGVNGPLMAVAATIVFGAAQVIHGRELLTQYYQTRFLSRSAGNNAFHVGGVNLALVFFSGATGVGLGLLALLGVNSAVLTPTAAIIFGAALVLSSSDVFYLGRLRGLDYKRENVPPSMHGEIVASEFPPDLVNIQMLAGLSVVILGTLAAADVANDLTLNLIALLCLGTTSVLAGGGLQAVLLNLVCSRSSS
jgi:hypothetical protein